MTKPDHARRGSKRKEWSIVVVAVPPDRYPAFRDDPAHQFMSMSPARRLTEIDEVCSRLWMSCNEAALTTTSEETGLAYAA